MLDGANLSVMLAPPPGAEERGAKIQLGMRISPSQIEDLGPMTLRVSAGGYPLSPQTFSSAGNDLYSADVPQDALATNILPFKFTFDKATWTDGGARTRGGDYFDRVKGGHAIRTSA